MLVVASVEHLVKVLEFFFSEWTSIDDGDIRRWVGIRWYLTERQRYLNG